MQKKAVVIGVSVAILAVILAAGSFMVLYRPYTIEYQEAPDSLKQESLAFLRDVVGFNLTEYQVVSSNFWLQWDVATQNGLPLYLLRYNLKSSSDEAHVSLFYTKANDTTFLHETYFEVLSNTLFAPAYPSDKVLNWTTDFLEHYTAYKNNTSYLLEMQKTLDTIDHIKPVNVTRGDVTLQITIKQFSEEEIYTTLQFRPTNATAHDYDNAVTLEFHNGVHCYFVDNLTTKQE